jgi:hypothetical protein
MKPARIALLLLSLVCLVPLAASAQWSWIDRDGRRVFSDQAPPADVPASQILKRPGARGAAAAAAPQAAAPVGVDPALKPAGRDKALEEKRKQAEAAEADKKKQHEAELTAARADNCSRARTSKATLDSGQRIAMVNPQGEKEFMSDEQRAAETKRLEQVIARDCPASDRQ